ncbi:MAG: hypothetical protein AAF682_09310 [Planctomycetota bacterium]
MPRFPLTPALLALLFGCVTPVTDPFEVVDRSTSFVSTSTVDAGVLEAQTAFAWDPDGESAGTVVLTYGTAPEKEVFAEWSPYVVADAEGPDVRGTGDAVLGFRHRFREAEEASWAYELATKLPLGSDEPELTSGRIDVSAALRRTAPAAGGTLTLTLDAAALGADEGVDAELGGQVLFGRPLRPGLAALFSAQTSVVPELDEWTAAGRAGVSFSRSDRWLVDLAVENRVGDGRPEQLLVAGVTLFFSTSR